MRATPPTKKTVTQMKIILRSYLRMYEDNSALLLRSTLLTLRTVLFKGYEGVL